MQAASASFIDEVREIDRIARQGSMQQQFAYGVTLALESLAQIVPTPNASFESVKIGALGAEGTYYTVIVDASAGQRISEAYKRATHRIEQVKGTVAEVNKMSDSFVLKDASGREVTCIAGSKAIRSALTALMRESEITVYGNYETRVRRDRMTVEQIEFADGTKFVRR